MIQKHLLSNGVRVVTEHIPSVRSVSIGIWIGTGSRYETSQNNGISHLIEHMLFKGTAQRSAKKLAEAFDRIGGQVNAFTAKECTCYYAKVLDEHAAYALEIMADMFFHSLLDPEELEKEKKVILEEIRMYEDTPDELVHDLLMEYVFGGHSLGYPIAGKPASLQKLTREDLLRFVKEQYTPENTVIAIAGNIQEGTLEVVEQLFGSFEGESSRPKIQSARFTPGVVRKVKDIEQAHLCLALPGYAVGDDRLYPLLVLNNILGGGMSSRLFQEVREERGLAYSIFSYHSAYLREGVFAVYSGTAPEQVEPLLEVVLEAFRRIYRHGVEEEELEVTKQQMKGSLLLGLESSSSRMNRLGKNELYLGRHLTLEQVLEKIESVTLEDVLEVARELFSKEAALSVVSPEHPYLSQLKEIQIIA